MYPKELIPQNFEQFKLENSVVEIPKCAITLEKWAGHPISNTFGGKGIINYNDKPMFAELAIMEIFAAYSWNARWVEVYGRGNKGPIFLTSWIDDKYSNQQNQIIQDDNINNLLANIAIANGKSYSGCWDVLAWKDDKIIFSELKRNKRDRIKDTQNRWSKAALGIGLSSENFLIVEWDYSFSTTTAVP